ncbi:hypothetical protein B8W90_14465, partial [Staphylococcus hominis]
GVCRRAAVLLRDDAGVFAQAQAHRDDRCGAAGGAVHRAHHRRHRRRTAAAGSRPGTPGGFPAARSWR